MEKLIFNEKTLSRIPPVFIIALLIVLGLPVLVFNVFHIDFTVISQGLGFYNQHGTTIGEVQFRNYFQQAILQWSAFCLSAITVLLAFTQYRLVNDKIALIVGLSVLFSGSVDALHTLIIDGVAPLYFDKPNLDAIVWTLTNTVSGLILLIGLSVLLKMEEHKKVSLLLFGLLSIFLVLAAFTLIYYTTLIIKIPHMWDVGARLSRPYELVYLVIFLIIAIVVYPKIYKKFPYILTNCVFYMSITEVAIALYMMILSSNPYDSAFNTAYFLKIIVYFIPFSCLIVNYVFSYNAILQAQATLQVSKDKLKYIAAHDSLTNLYNRREFDDQINQRIALCAKEKISFALLLIDIDNFKLINDTLGHIHGDEYIKKFASELRILTRKSDILSRIGGDEFTLITPKLKARINAQQLADRLIGGLSKVHSIGGNLITNTSSIGIAIYPDDGKTSQELLRKADIAMYAAKNTGKNKYQFFSETMD